MGGNTLETTPKTSLSATRATHVATSSPTIHTNPLANCIISVAKKENARPRHKPRVVTGATVSNVSTTTAVTPSDAPSRCVVVGVSKAPTRAKHSSTNLLA